jgi:branched-subunit amino acid transport protein
VKLGTLEVWLTIVLLMVLILLLRCGVFFLPRKYQPKGAFAEALGFAPLAALVAICAPEVAKFRMDALVQGASLSENVSSLGHGIAQDWRLWGAVALLVTVLLTKHTKRAALYGLAAAASIVWFI